jgi:hypothetical protein
MTSLDITIITQKEIAVHVAKLRAQSLTAAMVSAWCSAKCATPNGIAQTTGMRKSVLINGV